MSDHYSPGKWARTARLAVTAVALGGLSFSMISSPASAAPQGPWVLPAGDISTPGQFAFEP